MFNTREIAYFIWGSLFLIILLFSKGIRSSVFDVIKSLFHKKFVYIYLITITYVSACVWLLYKVKIWEDSLIKDTIVWMIFVALPLIYNSIKINSFKEFVTLIIRPLIALSVIFEYIIGLYTFDWWIEILLLPIAFVFGGILAFSKPKPEYEKIYNLVNGLVIVLGLVTLIAISIHLYNHYKEYLNKLTLLQFVVPLFLSLMFLPLLYAISMFAHYENAFIPLKMHFKFPDNYNYAIFKALFRFNIDFEGLEQWKRIIFARNFQKHEEIDYAITLVKTLQKAEKSPIPIDEKIGWSPYNVKNLLISKGIKTPNYTNVYDDEFCAISFPLKLNDDPIFSDTITYMVFGKQMVATELHLQLKIYYGNNNNSKSLMELIECSEILYKGIFGTPLPIEIKESLINSKYYETSNSLSKISVRKNLWKNKNQGYDLSFTVTHIKHLP